jgi:hypothetical protein
MRVPLFILQHVHGRSVDFRTNFAGVGYLELVRSARRRKIQRCRNVAVLLGEQKNDPGNALRERAGRCAVDLLVEPFWVALLQTQMDGTVSPKMKSSAPRPRENSGAWQCALMVSRESGTVQGSAG